MNVATLKKEQLLQLLTANKKAVKKDKYLNDLVTYTEKMYKKDPTKVKKTDLVSIAKLLMQSLGDKLINPALAEESTMKISKEAKPKAENSLKKAVKKSSDDKEKTPKKSAKKEAVVPAKKETPKKSTKKETKKDNLKTLDMVESFPDTITVDDTTYELANDIKTMDDLYEAMNNGENIVFAFYWTQRHLKQFDYFGQFLGQPESFDDDLDLSSAIYVSDEKKVAYAVSLYTEAVYIILPKDLELVGNVRVSAGIEYQIYRAVEESEEE